MYDALCGLSDFANVYLDDILVCNKSVDQHLTHIRAVLQWLHDKQLQAKHSKYEFLYSLVCFLGHIVSGTGVSPDPEIVTAIVKLADPTDMHTLCSFLGCCNYYDQLIPHYA